jgi:serine/threonine protein kinase
MTWMVTLGESRKVVLIKAFLNIVDRNHEVECYNKLKHVQGVFIPKLLKEDCRAPSLYDERKHALMLSWIGPLWSLDCRQLSASELLAVQDDVLRMHALGVVHRDLGPHNLVRDASGRVFIVDFDMALVRTMPCGYKAFEEECALERELLQEQIQSAYALECQERRVALQ